MVASRMDTVLLLEREMGAEWSATHTYNPQVTPAALTFCASMIVACMDTVLLLERVTAENVYSTNSHQRLQNSHCAPQS